MTDHYDFIPPSEVKIDPKNRLPVGAVLKRGDAGPSEELMLTIGFDGCLYFLSIDRWNELMSKLEEKGDTNKQALRFQRMMNFFASKVKPDAQWRVVVPPRLMELAGFTNDNRDACLFWVGKRLEVWERSCFDSYTSGQSYKLHPKVEELRKAAEELTL